VIDESLDRVENPNKEGRYRFTLAHEGGGHWRLHRRLFAKDPAQVSLFNEPAPPSVVCRSSQAKEPARLRWLTKIPPGSLDGRLSVEEPRFMVAGIARLPYRVTVHQGEVA